MVQELTKEFKGEIGVFRPYAPASDRAAWEALPGKLKMDLVKKGESCLGFAYPMLPATRYMEFCREGDRERFELIYFERRYALNALVMAECVEHSGRFMDDIVNGVMAICEESGWQLPAHNSNRERSEMFCLPDITDPYIDLFACETGEQMAMVSYLLHKELEGVTPFLTKRINYELHTRILEPYLNHHFWWMGEKGVPTNNWTPWCTQNAMIAIFSLEDVSQERKRKALEKAAYSLDVFLDTYGEDGCCDEGASYYRAAGLALFNAIEVMDAVTGDHFIGLYRETKIKNIAPYVMNVHIHDRYYANFADCSTIAGRAGVREYLFAKRVGNPDMMIFAAQEHEANREEPSKRTENLFYRVQAAFTEEEIGGVDISGSPRKEDVYYKSVGLLVARDSRLFLAAKAGHNDDSHNHNDTGSITVYKDGKPLLIDVGVETYSRKTFSDHRYEIWTMQSGYHNLLTFGDVMQLPGREYAARDVQVEMAADRVSMTMELSGAYPAGTVESYHRTVVFEKEKEIRVTDRCSSLPKGTFLTLLSLAKPTVDGDRLVFEATGEIRAEGSYTWEVEKIDITDKRLFDAWGGTLYRTRLFLQAPEITLIIPN
ncbi:MAG: heparinase II/III family protein [Oscillospiraceae bacterium]